MHAACMHGLEGLRWALADPTWEVEWMVLVRFVLENVLVLSLFVHCYRTVEQWVGPAQVSRCPHTHVEPDNSQL